MSTLPNTFLSPDEYLEIERKTESRSEYYDGQMFPMSAVSKAHDRIKTRLQFLIYEHLRGRNCELFSSDMRVLVPSRRYFHPDLSVVCGEQRFDDDSADTLVNPTLLVEVLSPSTQDYDRGRKAK